MHYTSPENIHKVIDPLFADALTQELADILEAPGQAPLKRRNALERFHAKIAGLTFFDPACGSGNFLTETYITLRRLENKVLSELSLQNVFAFEDIDASPLKVSLDQFYGLEINDFAVSVASTALWIAQLQANIEARSIITTNFEDLPLTDAAQIRQGNALRMDWREVIEPGECDYIIGNPPFLGYSRLSDEQKVDRAAIFGKDGGLLDYVACWHKKSADFMRGTTAEAALVSTNSICQGQQVSPLWKPLFDDGLRINFAHRTFTWSNESTDQAKVSCIIVGFSHVERERKMVWDYRRATKDERAEGSSREIVTAHVAMNINGYLADAPKVFLSRRSKPISDLPAMFMGNKPTDGGHLILSPQEKDELIRAEPRAEQFIRKFSMGVEFINGLDRYCLWLVDAKPQEIASIPLVRERVRAVKEVREVSTKAATQKKAATPWLFDEVRYLGDGPYIGVPPVSSERRRYIPMAFVDDGMIPGNQLYFVPTDSLFVFGILVSTFHNAWMRSVAGRLESRYRYGNTTVYNNLVFPQVDEVTRQSVESSAQAVLDARASYEGATLADLYDPDDGFLYPKLVQAHQELDATVERTYGVDFSHLDDAAREQAIVAHLFELYAKAATA